MVHFIRQPNLFEFELPVQKFLTTSQIKERKVNWNEKIKELDGEGYNQKGMENLNIENLKMRLQKSRKFRICS